METEVIDKLFLELAQVTNATSPKETKLDSDVDRLRRLLQQVIWSVERGESMRTDNPELWMEICEEFNPSF